MAPAAHADLVADGVPSAPAVPGQRLLCDVIDSIAATTPDRVWASSPRSADLSQGFEDITYAQWANAIHHASHWLEATFGPVPAGAHKVIVYRGPYDARYPTLYVAGIRTRISMLCLSYFVSLDHQLTLMDTLGAEALVHTGNDPFLARMQARRPSLRSVVAPALADWFTPVLATPYLRAVTFAEAIDTPAVAFHTSGTTSLEKPFVYTNRMLARIDLHGANPRLPPNSTPKLMHGARWYTSFPLHTMIGLQPVVAMAVFWGGVAVLNPHVAGILPSAAEIAAVLAYGRIDGLQAAPKQLDALVHLPGVPAQLARLRAVQYAGSKMTAATGDVLAAHGVQCQAMIGSTEAGGYPTLAHADPDWRYIRFGTVPGLEFRPWAPAGQTPEPHLKTVNVLGMQGPLPAGPPPGKTGAPLPTAAAGPPAGPLTSLPSNGNGSPAGLGQKPAPAAQGLYELVFIHNPAWPHGQQIFAVRPELQKIGWFATGDVFRPHPRVPGLWLMEGRTVDFLAFPADSKPTSSSPSTEVVGEPATQVVDGPAVACDILNVSTYEDALLSASPAIDGVMVGGRGLARPFVIVELRTGAAEVENHGIDVNGDAGKTTVEQNPAVAPDAERRAQAAALVAVGEVNERLGLRGNARMAADRVIFATPQIRLVRNAKDCVNRAGTEQLFRRELEALGVVVPEQ